MSRHVIEYSHITFATTTYIHSLISDYRKTISMSSSEGASGSSPPPPTRFTIDEEVRRQYRRFNAEGTELKVRLLPPPDSDNTDPMTHFQASVNELFRYALVDCQDSDMVGLTIRNEVNVLDKPIAFNFRRKYHFRGRGLVRLREGSTI